MPNRLYFSGCSWIRAGQTKEDSQLNETELVPSLRDVLWALVRQEGSSLVTAQPRCVARIKSCYLIRALETELTPMASVYFPNQLFMHSLLLFVLVLALILGVP